MNDKTDVLIVGAGPTGLTLAVDLARRGVACRIVDQAAEPAGGSKGKGLQPRTLEVFDDLGVVGPILAAATPYPPVRVRVGRVPIWRARMHKPVAATYPLVMMHPQWRTEAVLRERLAELGGKVEQGSALTGFEQDAAHVHSPAGGQGLNTGVQDAYNLGWKLARALAGAPEGLLGTYEEERRPVAARVLGLSSDLHDKRSLKRDEETYQLMLGYRGGSLALRGGERVPDGPLPLADGTSARMFDLLRGPHFTLLSPDPAPRVGPEVRAYAPASPYGGKRHTLIRPDGYVGIATSSAEELSVYLAMV